MADNKYKSDPVDSNDSALHELLERMQVLQSREGSRELALAITKLEESLMWYRTDYFIRNTKDGNSQE